MTMKYPLLSNLLLRKYPQEALEEITSGKDLLPFPTNEKRQILTNFAETAEARLMNGDNLLQAAFYDSPLRNIFKHRYDSETFNGVSAGVYCNELLVEIKDCLKKTNPNHLGKMHRNLLSLMVTVPNLPEKMLLNLVEKTDVLQKDAIGHTALDAACISMLKTAPVNKETVLAIYEKAGINDVKEYQDKISKEHNKESAKIVGVQSYVEGFRKVQELKLQMGNTKAKKSLISSSNVK